MKDVSRKSFVTILGTATAVAVAPSPAVAQMSMGSGGNALGSEPEAYTFFTEPEVAIVEAAVERLIPTDALGPGAKSAGVAYFIDQQLAGAFGTGANMFRGGPWAQGTPNQGYQLRQTPAELYRQSLAALALYCKEKYQSTFSDLTAAQQDEVLHGLDGGTIKFDVVPAKTWFELLLQNTIEGFFSDPLYGGNRDKVGWKLVGFPGVAANYREKIKLHNQPYNVPPVSIADVQQGKPVAAGHELMHNLAMGNAARLNEVNR